MKKETAEKIDNLLEKILCVLSLNEEFLSRKSLKDTLMDWGRKIKTIRQR